MSMIKATVIAIGCAAAATWSGGAQAQATYFPHPDGLPFSEAVQVGDILYLSGQIGVAPGTTVLVPGGIEAEARQTLDNIGAVLARRGLGFDAVVKCTVMLADMADWPAFNAVYRRYFRSDRLPARSAFGATPNCASAAPSR